MFLTIVILSMFVVCKAAIFQCSPGIYQCHLYQWTAWSTCSASCGGGVTTRFKKICCSLNLMSFSDCAAFCNYTADKYLDKMVCGESCLNGVFTQNSCHCPSGFTGKCCQNVVQRNINATENTSPSLPFTIMVKKTTLTYSVTYPQAEGYTSAKSVNKTINGYCKNVCKFGYCHNAYCVCSTFFQGDTCEKPREWFLVMVCILGSFPMLILFYWLSKRFGIKATPDNKVHDVM